MFYVLAIGGTGNKVMEAIVYGAAADIFYRIDDTGTSVPLDCIHILSIDVDASCGNTTRAKLACASYQKVYQCIKGVKRRHRGFHTELDIKQWNMSTDIKDLSIDAQVSNFIADQPLARALFDKTESSLEYSEGFRGHPDLGILFFSDLLEKVKDGKRSDIQDEFVIMLNAIQRDLELGDKVRVILVGSIFGGTGAAGIPILSKFLRQRYASFGKNFQMAVTVLLPYYSVPASTSNEDVEIVINSTVFMDKAKTALDFYGAEQLINAENGNGIYDALYLLGLPQEAFVSTRKYATGSGAQENDAHIMEWIAVRSIAHFFRLSYLENIKPGCYAYQIHTPMFCWESFDAEEKRYRLQYGGMIKAAIVYLVECYPYIRNLLEDTKRIRCSDVNYYASFFSKAHKLSHDERKEYIIDLDEAASFLSHISRWMLQMLGSMPPTLREPMKAELDLETATKLYQKLLDLRVKEIQMQKSLHIGDINDSTKQMQLLQSDKKDLVKELTQIEAHISVQECNTMRYYTKQKLKAELTSRYIQLALEKEQLSTLLSEKPDRILPEQIDRQQQLVSNEERVLERLEVKNRLIEEDWQKILLSHSSTKNNDQRFQVEIPQNNLMDTKLMQLFSDFFLNRGFIGSEKTRNKTKDDFYLLSHIQDLTIQRMRDDVTIQQIMAKLGKGAPLFGSGRQNKGNGIKRQSPVAEFLITLFYSVYNEVYPS